MRETETESQSKTTSETAPIWKIAARANLLSRLALSLFFTLVQRRSLLELAGPREDHAPTRSLSLDLRDGDGPAAEYPGQRAARQARHARVESPSGSYVRGELDGGGYKQESLSFSPGSADVSWY